MINRELFDKITQKYGSVASWAIWDEFGERPKSNMSNIKVLDPDINTNLLQSINNNVIMVGLNFARPVNFDIPYMNFHDSNPHANDFKIRYAFNNTIFYGAYMTDVIKNYPEINSKNVEKHIKENPEIIDKSINEFVEELIFIGSNNPVVFCFGSQTYNLLKIKLEKKYYKQLVPLIHYSHQISKEKYKLEVLNKITEYLYESPSKKQLLLNLNKQLEDTILIIKNVNIGIDENIETELQLLRENWNKLESKL
jgi:hypothetical protein